MKRLGLAMGVLAVLMTVGCRERVGNGSPDSDSEVAHPTRIVVTIPPLKWAVDGLAPEGAEVTLIVPPGASAHGYELTPSQAAAIAGADLVVMVGMGMEPRVEAALAAHRNERRTVLRFEQVVGSDAITDGDEHDHDHAHGDEHAHSADPHAWLDPVLMGRFVERLAGVMPADGRGSAAIEEAASELKAECAAVDEGYRAALARTRSKSIVTHHNAYSYLARRYGLTVAAVIQGGGGGGGGHAGEPTPGEIARAVGAVRAAGVAAVFVEPQLNDSAARRVAEAAEVGVLTLDPLGDGDWPAMMRANLRALVQGLGAHESSGAGGGG